MSELEKILKDVVYGGVGAIASVLETGSGLAKTFVEKGHKIVQDAKPAAEDWARKVQETCDEALKSTGIDISNLSREQREQLTALMNKLNKLEDAAAKALKGFATELQDAVKEEPDEASDDCTEGDFEDECEGTDDVVVEAADEGMSDDGNDGNG